MIRTIAEALALQNRGTIHAIARVVQEPSNPSIGGPIRALVVSLLGAPAVAAGLLIIRQKDPEPQPRIGGMHAGESQAGTISLEKIRELGY